jgi:SAM-dependent methyltransferase
VRGSADALPFRDGAFDAAMALLTMHHWPDWRQGLVEMRRVARRVVLFTWDPDAPAFWLVRDYVPAVLEVDRPVFPTFGEIARVLGPVDVRPVPIPSDCTDGFLAAYWRRPEAYLDADVRGAISVFARIPDLDGPLARLAADLADGTWAERWGWLLQQTEFDAGYRLVTAGDPPAWPSGESTMPS